MGSETLFSELVPVGLHMPECEVRPEQFSHRGLVLYRLVTTNLEKQIKCTGFGCVCDKPFELFQLYSFLLFDAAKES